MSKLISLFAINLMITTGYTQEIKENEPVSESRAISIRDRNQSVDKAPALSSKVTLPEKNSTVPSKAVTSTVPSKKPIEHNSKGLVPLSVKATKTTYRVNEAIEFEVQAKEAYYLYVFNIDAKNDQVILLLPNDKTKNNRLNANQPYRIPGTVEFYSDSPGTEKVIFIGTRELVDLNTLHSKTLGAFKVAKPAALSDAFATRAIRIRDAIDQPEVKNVPVHQKVAEGMTVIHLNIQP